MSYTNLDLITDAAIIINMIATTETLPGDEQTVLLNALNDMMADLFEDGINLGWYPQTSVSATAPLAVTDVRCVKLLFGREIAMRKGLTATLPADLKEEMEKAEEKLSKRTTEYFEADMSGLPVPQGAYWGGQAGGST